MNPRTKHGLPLAFVVRLNGDDFLMRALASAKREFHIDFATLPRRNRRPGRLGGRAAAGGLYAPDIDRVWASVFKDERGLHRLVLGSDVKFLHLLLPDEIGLSHCGKSKKTGKGEAKHGHFLGAR